MTAQTSKKHTNINSLTLNGDGATVSSIKDEDNMASDSATALATQQSIKAYDSQVGANNELSEVLANGNTSGGQISNSPQPTRCSFVIARFI